MNGTKFTISVYLDEDQIEELRSEHNANYSEPPLDQHAFLVYLLLTGRDEALRDARGARTLELETMP